MKNFDQVYFTHIPKTGGSTIGSLFRSKPWFNYRGHKALKQKPQEREFHFCVVRNPWDRLVSAYHYMHHKTEWEHDKLDLKKYLPEKNFDEFVRNFYKNRLSKIMQQHLMFQLNWCSQNGTIIVDRVLRFENLDNEIRELSKLFEANIDNYKDTLSTIPVINKSQHRNYKEYYTNETKNMVANIYKIDIEAFNYKFDS